MELITYDKFINNILEARGRFACGDEYHERHHIVPRCCNGTDDDNNLIDLYAKEHFEAHRLLALENPNNDGLTYAWLCMSVVKKDNVDRYFLSPEEYEEVKIAYANMCSDRYKGDGNPFYGKHHSEDSRKIISEKAKNRDRSLWNLKGLELGHGTQCWTEDTYKKLSEINRGENSATSKLTEDNVIDILNMINHGCFYSEIREKYDISDAEISRIKNKIRWGYLYDKYPELYDFQIVPKVKFVKSNNTSGVIGVS